MWNGGVSDSESTRSSSGIISISPVAMFSLTAPDRFATFPTTATTYSLRSFAAFSISAASTLPSSNTTWIIPERSLTSTNTRPPLLRFFCTQPIMVAVSPTLAADSSPHLWVLFKPCIDSAIFLYLLFHLCVLFSTACLRNLHNSLQFLYIHLLLAALSETSYSSSY